MDRQAPRAPPKSGRTPKPTREASADSRLSLLRSSPQAEPQPREGVKGLPDERRRPAPRPHAWRRRRRSRDDHVRHEPPPHRLQLSWFGIREGIERPWTAASLDGNSLFGRFYKADAVAVSPARSAICARRRMASGRTGVVGASDLGQTVDGRQAATPRRLILTRVFLKGIAPNGGEHEGRRRDRAGTASRVLDVAARVLDPIAIAAGFYGGCGAQHHRGAHDRSSQEASGERAHGALVPASESAPPSTALESRHRLERARTARRAASVPGYSRSSRS